MNAPSDLRPLVIGCTGGSGSRMLRDLLAAVPEIFMDQHVSPYSKDSYGCKALLHRRDQDSPAFRAELLDFMNRVREQIPAALREQVRWFGWKRPAMLAYADVLLDLDPRLHFLHLVRHPATLVDGNIGRKRYKRYRDARDRCTVPGRTPFILTEWADTNLPVLLRHRHNPRYLVVRYEDLLENTIESIETLFDWLGVDRGACVSAARAVAPPLNALSRGREIDVSLVADAVAAFGYAAPPSCARQPAAAARTQLAEPPCT